GRQLILEFDIDRFRMTHEHRHTHAGGGQLDLRIEYLLGFDHHLPLFLGRAIVEKAVDVRNHVEGDLLGELARFRLVADEYRAALLEQLVHALLARAGDRLIGADHDTLYSSRVVQRLESDDHLRRGAIRVRDDV